MVLCWRKTAATLREEYPETDPSEKAKTARIYASAVETCAAQAEKYVLPEPASEADAPASTPTGETSTEANP